MVDSVRLIDRLNMAQRAVIVVAIGIALAVFGRYLVSLGGRPRMGRVFYGFTNRSGLPGTGLAGWVHLIIWLGLTVLWALASVIVLRPPRGPAEPH